VCNLNAPKSPPFSGPVVGLSHSVFLSRLKNSPFLQVRSSIAFPNNPLARLHGYLTIAGVGTSLMELVWFSAAD